MRKRPGWIPGVVDRLYADKPVDPEKPVKEMSLEGHDFMKTRRNCTIGIISLFAIDVVVPVIVPLGIFIVRKRPNWFIIVTKRLYADQLQDAPPISEEPVEEVEAEIGAKKYIGSRLKGARQGA